MLLSILVLFATQPLQASFCDMHTDTKSAHQTMPAAEQPENDMRVGMDHGSNNPMMDCCGDKPQSSEHNCTAMAHCGACPAALAVISLVTSSAWLATSNGNMPALSQVPPNQFSSPPFRPPIS